MKQLGAKMHNPKLITKVSAFAMIALVITLVIVGVGIPDPAEPTDGLATVDSISVTNQNTSPSDLVAQYCVVCHNEYLNTGGLALDGFDVNSVQDNPDIWEKVLRKLRANAMPPTGMPRPDEASFSQFESYLSDSLDTLALNSPNPGRTATFSRLSRLQYENAIRDLLALEVDVSELLPKDDASFGFDNVNLTNLSPALMERYLAAAQKISRLAVGSPLNSPATHVERITANLTQEDRLEGLPFGTRGGTTFIYQFPRDGDYRLDVLLARDRNENISRKPANKNTLCTKDDISISMHCWGC